MQNFQDLPDDVLVTDDFMKHGFFTLQPKYGMPKSNTPSIVVPGMKYNSKTIKSRIRKQTHGF